MGEEAGGEKNVKTTIDAVTGLFKAVPIYDDMVQPVAKQLGKSLETVGKAINVALAPVGILVWGYEKCQEFISTKVADRLKDVAPEDIITPKPNVAGPAIEALRYTGHEESLSDMYANLLAAAMDKNTANEAHPAFVEIIKQLTPDEAKLIAYFMEPLAFPLITVRAGEKEFGTGNYDVAVNVSLFGELAKLDLPDLVPMYIDNLCRLGLAEAPPAYVYSDKHLYYELETSSRVEAYRQQVALTPELILTLVRGGVKVTSFGKQFGDICIRGRS
ncbi:DUF4393 domain-containing protein [Pseudomonas sp.]|uniref:DUF4393 domain-containing protein n=1 Tax=Pseudomonas sp. TaxID=306 RepID=UPI002611BD8F|nr:DUF4393 domain-containing protein [Pseudomonas sp.]